MERSERCCAWAKILVVDDEAQIVRVLRGYLERAGFVVLSAYDGQEAYA